MARTVSQTISLKRPDEPIEKYITRIDGGGIKIHDSQRQNLDYLQLTSSGIDIKQNNISLASFTANGAQIGKTSESRFELDYHSMKLIDKEGDAYFYVSDLRSNYTAADEYGEGFYAVVTDTFTGDGSSINFFLSNRALTINYKVYVDGIEESNVIKAELRFALTTAPADGSVVTAIYPTASQATKAYTAGLRKNDGIVGVMSFAEGFNIIASGYYSHAEGGNTKASGDVSHAEGNYTVAKGHGSHAEGNVTTASGTNAHAEGNAATANGYASHAEGGNTTASGMYSHAQNRNTVAGYEAQTVIGKYNDNQSGTAFEIGNGTADSARSNALTVDWDGNLTANGDITSNGDIIDSTGRALSEIPNIHISTSAPTSSDGENGDIWITYTA